MNKDCLHRMEVATMMSTTGFEASAFMCLCCLSNTEVAKSG